MSNKHSTMTVLNSTKASIIIAAYNEASVIGDTLSQLCTPAGLATYQIIVVCNGCSDGTDKVVLGSFPEVHCHTLAKASKANAIRYAEALEPGFPRLYLDADIKLSAENASALLSRSQQQGRACLMIPTSKVATSGCANTVKSFYRAWYNTAHVQQSGYGAGAYTLNQKARSRFQQWPDLIADDAFVRTHFSPDETLVARDIDVSVKAPKTLWSLIKVKSRSKLGNLQLKAYAQDHVNHTSSRDLKSDRRNPHRPGQHRLSTTPQKWYDIWVYIVVNILALSLAKWAFFRGEQTWYRDNSNR